jgi:hypothetical protein
MLDRVSNIFKIPELRDRILFTLMIFLVYRIGGHVPVAGITARADRRLDGRPDAADRRAPAAALSRAVRMSGRSR